jgi:phage shock protein A
MGIFKKKQPADAVDLVLMRSELDELRERLTAAEQAKASLEDRLSSLAATTMVLSSATKNDTAEIVDQIESIQRRIGESQAVGSKVDELHRRVVDVEQRSTTLAPPSQVEARLAVLDARQDPLWIRQRLG